jgi:hypothetical protein
MRSPRRLIRVCGASPRGPAIQGGCRAARRATPAPRARAFKVCTRNVSESYAIRVTPVSESSRRPPLQAAVRVGQRGGGCDACGSAEESARRATAPAQAGQISAGRAARDHCISVCVALRRASCSAIARPQPLTAGRPAPLAPLTPNSLPRPSVMVSCV